MTLITRAAWGAAPPDGSYTSVRHGGQGTVHYSASPITPGGSARPKPEKPGPKWYRLWRSKVTPVAQRRAISKTIRAYNEAVAEWRKEGGAVPPALAELERRTMRQIQAFHQGPSRGWLDIAYHRLIFATGNVYEGRPLGVQGSHAIGANETVGYCFVMGAGDTPTPAMLDAFRAQATSDGVRHYAGHRQRPGNSTTCPGDALIAALDL